SCRVRFRVVPGLLCRVGLMPRPAMRTDDVESSVGECRPFRVEFQQLAGVAVSDEANEVAGDQFAILDDHDLRALRLVIDDEADTWKAGWRRAGYAAGIFGLLEVRASRVLSL